MYDVAESSQTRKVSRREPGDIHCCLRAALENQMSILPLANRFVSKPSSDTEADKISKRSGRRSDFSMSAQ